MSPQVTPGAGRGMGGRATAKRVRAKGGPAAGREAAGASPNLRIVRPETSPASPRAKGDPVAEATDPRWVLALRVAEQLQGALLDPEQRERLLRLGRALGLSPFDSNLVIAIVQDQARRGVAPAQCPQAGAQQLGMVPRPPGATLRGWLVSSRWAVVGWLATGLIGLELAVAAWLWL
jgi:hypothetical protein